MPFPAMPKPHCPPPGALGRSFLAIFICCSLALLFSACAPKTRVTAPEQEMFASLSDTLRSQAREYEKKGDLQQALLRWMILQSLNPKDQQTIARVASLKQETRAKATEHFDKGVAFYQQGRLKDARREFLYTLTYEQDHAGAVDYLVNRLQDNVFTTYQVRKGDTCKEIARRVYHDAGKDFLITAFNKVNGSCQPSAGTELKLVVLDQDPAKFADAMPDQQRVRRPVPERPNDKGKVDSYTGDGADVPGGPKGEKAKADRNAEKYEKARALLKQKKDVEALRLLKTIDANYRDVAKLTAATDALIQQEADAHYRKGISYYLSENLDKAIKEWEEVLRLRPDDLKAKKDLENARRLKEKINKY